MTETQIELIVATMTQHYGASKVVVDSEYVFVYGVDSEFTKLALETLLPEYDITIEVSEDSEQKCLCKFVKKVVDKKDTID